MLFFLFLLLLVCSLGILLTGTREKTLSTLLRQRLIIVPDGARSSKIRAPLLESIDDEHSGLLGRFGARLGWLRLTPHIEQLLLEADSQVSVSVIVLSSTGLSLAAAAALLILTGKALLLCCGFLVGPALTYTRLRQRRAKRLRRFDDALPEAMELMARSLRAGHSITGAVEIVAEQSAQPLAREFKRVFQQQRLGVHLREALLAATARTPSADFRFLVTAILVQRESGGDLMDILDRAVQVIRDRVRIRAEVRVHTAQGRLTGWILSLLPVILLVLINLIDPSYTQLLFQDPTGQKMLAAGTALICFGAFVIRKIVDVRV